MKAFLESQLQSLRETLEVDAEARAEREGGGGWELLRLGTRRHNVFQRPSGQVGEC